MARRFFCAYCGTPIHVSRKSLPNKGMIIDVVRLHDCDDRNVSNITDAEVPTKFKVEIDVKEAEDRVVNALVPESLDRRSKDSLRKPLTSSAPTGVLSQVKQQIPSTPARDMAELDKESDDA